MIEGSATHPHATHTGPSDPSGECGWADPVVAGASGPSRRSGRRSEQGVAEWIRRHRRSAQPSRTMRLPYRPFSDHLTDETARPNASPDVRSAPHSNHQGPVFRDEPRDIQPPLGRRRSATWGRGMYLAGARCGGTSGTQPDDLGVHLGHPTRWRKGGDNPYAEGSIQKGPLRRACEGAQEPHR